MKESVDIQALAVGSGVAFVSFISFLWFFDQLGYYPNQDQVTTWLFFIISTMPGAITAGYLHSEKAFKAAIYGMAVILIGVVLPMIFTLVLFFTFLAFISGPSILMLSVFFVPSIPILLVIVIGSGSAGGVIGALLRRYSID